MNRLTRLAPLALVASAMIAAACARTPEPEPIPEPVVNQDSIDAAARAEAERRAAEEAAAAERARADSIRMAEEARMRMMTEARNTLTSAIYFDFDQSAITDQARATLDSKLPLLNANAGLRIRIAGNTDERGSDEYNMALGQRRAASAKRYLTDRGIAADRIDIVSYGEERPVCESTDESCYSQNRRDEFEIIAGGDNLTVPGQ